MRASLQAEYGIRLIPRGGGRTDPARTVTELCDYVASLPPGSALWRATGGTMAESEDGALLREIELDLRMLAWMNTEDGRAGRNRPQKIKPPQLAHEVAEAAEKQNAKAAAHQRRQQKRSRQTSASAD